MKFKKIIILISLVFILILSTGMVSATDSIDITNVDTNVIDNNSYSVAVGDDNPITDLNAGDGDSFTDLDKIIKDSDSVVDLNHSYKYYNDSDYNLQYGIVINKSLIIDGHGFTIDGSNLARALNVDKINLTLKNIIFVNCTTEKLGRDYSFLSGGAISYGEYEDEEEYKNYIIGNFTNCTFINCSSEMGGAISSQTDDIIIDYCNFIDCNATCLSPLLNYAIAQAGAINVAFNENGLFKDCLFKNCTAYGGNANGGAITTECAEYGEGNFVNCSFIGCMAYTTGENESVSGAINWLGGNVNYICCTFNNCFASDGGAINSVHLSSVMSDCSFDNCFGTVKGGAIILQTDNTLVKDCNFTNCYVRGAFIGFGGAAVMSVKNGTISNCIFKDCYSDSEGGALYSENSAGLLVDSCSFLDNKAVYGGAISVRNSRDVLFNNTNFTNNSAFFGGVGYITQAVVAFDNCELSSNNAINPNDEGTAGAGAIVNYNNYECNISNSVIKDNTVKADYALGSVIINYGFMNLDNVSIFNNSLSCKNKVENDVIYNIGGEINVINSNITNNSYNSGNQSVLYSLSHPVIYGNLSFNNTNIPSQYDLRKVKLENGSIVNYLTPVKDQGMAPVCWVFAGNGVLESYLLRNGIGEYNFSENNVKNSLGYNSEYGYDIDPNSGGSLFYLLNYWARWSGPVNGSDDPYDEESVKSPDNLPELFHLQDVVYLPKWNTINDLKLAILNYGAVAIAVDWEFETFPAIIEHPVSQNHAIILIGWDDNYYDERFGEDVPKGAFILKNSWGSWDEARPEYPYISYYDESISKPLADSFLAITNVESIYNYAYNYQYDLLGNLKNIGYDNCETAWFANQFTAESNNPLSAFSLYNYGVNSPYEAYIYVNGDLVHTQSGNILNPGYNTIKLNSKVDLNDGDIFKIVIKLTTPGCYYPIPIETQFPNFSSKAYSEPNQSFISPDGENWYDISKYTLSIDNSYATPEVFYLNGSNVCLKAFTDYLDSILEVENKTIDYKDNDSLKVVFKDLEGTPIANEKITVRIFNNFHSYVFDLTTNDDGIAIINLNKIASGNYTVISSFKGNKNFLPVSNISYLIVKPLDTKIVFDVTKLSNGKYLIKGKVFDYRGDLVDDGYVNVTIGDKVYKVKLNKGEFSIIIKAPSKNGVYDVIVNYYSSNNYISSNATIYGCIIVNSTNTNVKGIAMENTAIPLLVLLFALISLPLVYRRK